MKKMAVEGTSVTASQLSEFFSRIAAGTITRQSLQAFIEGRNPFKLTRRADILDAALILGDKVVTYNQVCEVFGVDKGTFVPEIRYNVETLEECAELNRTGTCDWRMVYALPLSLREQRDIIGVNTDSQPCFYNNDSWLGEAEDTWAKSQPEAGYYLIDFKGRFNRCSWNDQNVRISEMGVQYERADERVFAQALVSIFKTHEERLHPGTYHLGRIENSGGYRVYVGGFDSDGLFVDFVHPSFDHDCVFVCVSRKFDF